MAKKTKEIVIDAEIIEEKPKRKRVSKKKTETARTKDEIMSEINSLNTSVDERKAQMEGNKTQRSVITRIGGDGAINTTQLSIAEKEKYTTLAKALDVRDMNSITAYGSELRNAMKGANKTLLETTRSSQVGDQSMVLLNELMTQVETIDIDGIGKKPNAVVKFLRKVPILRHLVSSIEETLHNFETVEKKCGEVEDKIRASRAVALRDYNILEQQFNNNRVYIKQLEELIVAGKIKSDELELALTEMEANSENYEACQIADVKRFKHELDKRVDSMLRWRLMYQQSLVQIRIIQDGNMATANNSQEILDEAMDKIREQLTMSIALYNQAQNIKLHDAVVGKFNEITKQNADSISENANAIVRQTEESVLSMETLRHTNDKLKETLQNITRTQEEYNQKRKAAEAEILHMQNDIDALSTHLLGSIDGDERAKITSK